MTEEIKDSDFIDISALRRYLREEHIYVMDYGDQDRITLQYGDPCIVGVTEFKFRKTDFKKDIQILNDLAKQLLQLILYRGLNASIPIAPKVSPQGIRLSDYLENKEEQIGKNR